MDEFPAYIANLDPVNYPETDDLRSEDAKRKPRGFYSVERECFYCPATFAGRGDFWRHVLAHPEHDYHRNVGNPLRPE